MIVRRRPRAQVGSAVIVDIGWEHVVGRGPGRECLRRLRRRGRDDPRVQGMRQDLRGLAWAQGAQTGVHWRACSARRRRRRLECSACGKTCGNVGARARCTRELHRRTTARRQRHAVARMQPLWQDVWQ